MTVEERRQALLEWFYADEERSGMGTLRIMQLATYRPTAGMTFGRFTWIYPVERSSRDRCFRDLKALERRGDITRGQSNGRATWWYA